MQVPDHIFREYDVRGLVEEDLTDDLVTALGRAFTTWVVERRGDRAPVIAVACQSNPLPDDLVDDQILIPDCHRCVLPVLASIPMQLLSYHIATLRGCDVDKPRNLAKSVTVE